MSVNALLHRIPETPAGRPPAMASPNQQPAALWQPGQPHAPGHDQDAPNTKWGYPFIDPPWEPHGAMGGALGGKSNVGPSSVLSHWAD